MAGETPFDPDNPDNPGKPGTVQLEPGTPLHSTVDPTYNGHHGAANEPASRAEAAGGGLPRDIKVRLAVLAGTVAFITLMLVGLLVGGEIGKFMLFGVGIAPVPVLALLAYSGVRGGAAAFFAYVWLVVVEAGYLLTVFNNTLTLIVKDMGLLVRASRDPELLREIMSSGRAADIIDPSNIPAFILTTLLLMLVWVVSLLMLARPVRVGVSRFIPIDPDSFVHKIALSLLTLILFASFVPLIALGGKPPLLEQIKSGQLQRSMEATGITTGPLDLIYQFAWTIPATIIAAGWPLARRFRETLRRLGMVRPTGRQVLLGVAAGVALAFVANLIIDPAINWLWTTMGWPTTDAKAVEQLLSGVLTPVGAVIVGVTAGVGEEMAVRGLLQPRIGLIASNLVFTSLHAFQYGADGLLSVFLIGLLLGLVRARTNTSTSAIMHGVYDFVLVMGSVLAAQS